MRVREPVVAGQFYAGESDRCRAELSKLLQEPASNIDPDARLLGGLVPHAGWTCSGAVAAKVFALLAAHSSARTIVLFGAAHRFRGREAALFGDGRWETPIGPVGIDKRLAERILGQTNLIVDDPYAHADEHSIEVQMPFVAELFPEAKVVPITVPPVPNAHEVGQAVGRTLSSYKYDALIIGTTDLTHYGPNYGFTPQGVGAKGNTWAKEVNDQPFIELVCSMQSDKVVAEASKRKSACGAGAVAATLGALSLLGASEGTLLQHTSSSEVLGGTQGEDMSDSVGYAAIVFT
ncbi:MAG: AmmeMemoRadiSam system protein B [Phycisphaerales bacterium]|nr:MAG: AmmeMemoRadiSam system protein B [Phycisphaerales bacterium]